MDRVREIKTGDFVVVAESPRLVCEVLDRHEDKIKVRFVFDGTECWFPQKHFMSKQRIENGPPV